MATVELKIAQITADATTQMRVALNEHIVGDYVQHLNNGGTFGPMAVIQEDNTYYLTDGFHRLEAYRLFGREAVEATITPGTLEDAIMAACAANAAHGLRRTNADKRKAVVKMLELRGEWSNVQIAQWCSVDRDTVSEVRRSLAESASENYLHTVRTYKTKHGTTAQMETKNIGGIGEVMVQSSPTIEVPIHPDVQAINEQFGGGCLPLQTLGFIEEQRIHGNGNFEELKASGYIQVCEEAEAVAITEPVERLRQAVKQREQEHRKQAALIKQAEYQEQVERIAAPQDFSHLPSVKVGSLWQLGKHWLYCGDSAEIPKLNLPHAAFAFADPPYQVGAGTWDYGFNWAHDYLTDAADIVAVTPGIVNIQDFLSHTKMPYRWSMAAWIDNGMTRGALGFGNWIYLALFSKQESIYQNAQDVIRLSITGNYHDHKGQKPTELLLRLLERFTAPGDFVIDPFLGTGTALLACESMGRYCIGGEANAGFCQTIIGRWQTITGETAHDYTL